MSSQSYAASYTEEYISESIKNEMVYYCFEGDSNLKIAFDSYRARITHFPFKKYNTVKRIKTERIDSDHPVFTDTYAEFVNTQKVAIFSITKHHNEVWDAEYKNLITGKKTTLNEVRFDLKLLGSMCFADIINNE